MGADLGYARLYRFLETAGHAREAEAVLATMPERAAGSVHEAIRPALDMRPATIGLYEVAQRD